MDTNTNNRPNRRYVGNAAPGLPQTPCGSRLTNMQEELDRDENGWPQAPINTRLRQMKIFLTDEDIYRDDNFKPKLEECRKFIRSIKFGHRAETEYNSALVAELELKIAVHDKWIREEEKPAEVDFDDEIEYENPRPEGRLMPAHWKPPSGAMAEELADLATADAAGWPLPHEEAKSHISDSELPEEERSNESCYTNLSALKNGSSSFYDPWYYTHKVAHVNADIDVVARRKLEDANKTWTPKGEEVTPYMWNPMPTDYLQPFLPPSAEKLTEKWRTTYEKLSLLLHSLCEAQMKAPRPVLTAVTNHLTTLAAQANQDDANGVANHDADRLANRYLCEGEWDESDYNSLKILTEEAYVDRPRNWVFHGEEASFVLRVERLLEEDHGIFLPPRDYTVSSDTVITAALYKFEPPLNLTKETGRRCLFRMGQDERIQLFGRWSEAPSDDLTRLCVARPIPNNYPENRRNIRYDINEWCEMASRCLKAYRILNMNMRAMDQDPLYMKHVVMVDFANNLQARIRLWEAKVGYEALATKWLDLARPLEEPGERRTLGLERARELLQMKLIEEAAEGLMGLKKAGDNGSPGELWNWRHNTQYTSSGDRFHHRRWDHSVQSEGESIRNQMEVEMRIEERNNLNHGIRSVVKVVDSEDDEDAMDLDEPEPAPNKYCPNNEAFFPFAETEQTNMVLQRHISENVPGRRDLGNRARRSPPSWFAKRPKGDDGDDDDERRKWGRIKRPKPNPPNPKPAPKPPPKPPAPSPARKPLPSHGPSDRKNPVLSPLPKSPPSYHAIKAFGGSDPAHGAVSRAWEPGATDFHNSDELPIDTRSEPPSSVTTHASSGTVQRRNKERGLEREAAEARERAREPWDVGQRREMMERMARDRMEGRARAEAEKKRERARKRAKEEE